MSLLANKAAIIWQKMQIFYEILMQMMLISISILLRCKTILPAIDVLKDEQGKGKHGFQSRSARYNHFSSVCYYWTRTRMILQIGMTAKLANDYEDLSDFIRWWDISSRFSLPWSKNSKLLSEPHAWKRNFNQRDLLLGSMSLDISFSLGFSMK